MATESLQRTTAFILFGVVVSIYSGCSGLVAPGTSSGEPSLAIKQDSRESDAGSDEQITQQDRLVMETVLLDLLANEDFFTFKRQDGGSEIVLDAKTEGESFYLRQNQIEGELEEGQLIPQELGDELRRRNKVGVSLNGFKPDDPSVLVRDLTELPNGIDFAEAFVKRFPNAKAYVEAWLNRQLLTFWRFEASLAAKAPRFHRVLRTVYNGFAPVVARCIVFPWMADFVYLLLKPLEWMVMTLNRLWER